MDLFLFQRLSNFHNPYFDMDLVLFYDLKLSLKVEITCCVYKSNYMSTNSQNKTVLVK